MQLENSFTVPSDAETAWQTLLDVEAIAPCMPGATLESVEGDDFSGNVKVKLGPVSMVYGGTASFLSKDESSHTAVIKGTGKREAGNRHRSGERHSRPDGRRRIANPSRRHDRPDDHRQGGSDSVEALCKTWRVVW